MFSNVRAVSHPVETLFDKFGVSYPKDGMTWDEVIEVAKKMTRNEDGIQYYGLTNSFDHTLKLNPLSIPAVDLKTETPTINQDERWKRLYQLFLTDLAQGPGYQEGMKQLGKVPDLNTFAKEYRVAMFPYLSSLYYAWSTEMKAFDWDVVSMPSFKDLPNVGSQLYPNYGIKHQLGEMDLNTALRGAEEEAKKKIAEVKSK